MEESNSSKPPKCPCGFWGSSKTSDLCSQCYKDHSSQPKEALKSAPPHKPMDKPIIHPPANEDLDGASTSTSIPRKTTDTVSQTCHNPQSTSTAAVHAIHRPEPIKLSSTTNSSNVHSGGGAGVGSSSSSSSLHCNISSSGGSGGGATTETSTSTRVTPTSTSTDFGDRSRTCAQDVTKCDTVINSDSDINTTADVITAPQMAVNSMPCTDSPPSGVSFEPSSSIATTPEKRGVKRSLETVEDSNNAASLSPSPQKNKKRCHQCNCKLELAQRAIGKCRCGYIFCSLHRLPELHSCDFDHKEDGRRSAREKMIKPDRHIGNSCKRIDS